MSILLDFKIIFLLKKILGLLQVQHKLGALVVAILDKHTASTLSCVWMGGKATTGEYVKISILIGQTPFQPAQRKRFLPKKCNKT